MSKVLDKKVGMCILVCRDWQKKKEHPAGTVLAGNPNEGGKKWNMDVTLKSAGSQLRLRKCSRWARKHIAHRARETRAGLVVRPSLWTFGCNATPTHSSERSQERVETLTLTFWKEVMENGAMHWSAYQLPALQSALSSTDEVAVAKWPASIFGQGTEVTTESSR